MNGLRGSGRRSADTRRSREVLAICGRAVMIIVVVVVEVVVIVGDCC